MNPLNTRTMNMLNMIMGPAALKNMKATETTRAIMP